MELRKPHLKMIFFMALVSCFFAPLFSSYTLIPHEQKLDDLFPVLSQAETAHIKLPNQLEALLISLPQASRSHMTMTVSAGSWQNPEHALGMAHLIEHLVIQNNKSDDSSDSFTKWVTKKGGSFDAYTNFSLTSYAFTLPNQDLPEGINQFSQALAHPDWSHENIQKEILVIEQEYQLQKNKNEQFYCLQAVANQHHPFSRFKSGNKQTLSSIDTADCVDWYHHHYDPIKMHMVIISPFPLKTLMDLTQTHFSGLIHHKQPSPLPKTPLFTPLKNGNFLCIKSKRNVSELSLIWEIPASLMNGDHTPAALLKTVINSSGKHSLIDALKELDLATSLKADTTQFSPSYAIIEIKYELTDKGVAHPHDVAKKTFQLITSLTDVHENPALIKEHKQKMLLNRCDSIGRNLNILASHMALNMALENQIFPHLTEDHALSLKPLLQHMSPTTCLYILTVPPSFANEFTLIEKWNQTPYNLGFIPPSELSQWTQSAKWPQIFIPNPYLPQTFKLSPRVETAEAKPELLIDDPMGKVYFIQDKSFGLPQTSIYLNIETPALDNTPLSKILSDIHTSNIYYKIERDKQLLKEAGVNIEITPNHFHYLISLSAWNEQFPTLFNKLLLTFFDTSLSENQFNYCKKNLLQRYKKRPFNQMSATQNEEILQLTPSVASKIEALESLSYEDYLVKAQSFFSSTYAKATIQGDLSKQEAMHLINIYSRLIPPHPFTHHSQRESPSLTLDRIFQDEIKLIMKPSLYKQPDLTVLLLDIACTNLTHVVQSILSAAIKADFLHWMRTKEKVSYTAHFNNIRVKDRNLLLFQVQSTSHTSYDMALHIDQFLDTFISQLPVNISYENFLDLKKNAIQRMHQLNPKTLSLKTASFHSHWVNHSPACTCQQKQLKILENLSYDEFIKHAQDLLTEGKRYKYVLISTPQ